MDSIRRALDVLFPKDRPLQLAVARPTTPDALDAATGAIHNAWTSGWTTRPMPTTASV
jgi:hypothetical protein